MGDDSETLRRSNNDREMLIRSTTGATFLMLTQFFTKILTFLLNQLLIRRLSPKVFGISSYLEFLVSMVLFFSREGERSSIQRTSDNSMSVQNENGKSGKFVEGTQAGTLQSIINFGYIPVAVGLPLSILIMFWQVQTQMFQDSVMVLPYYKISIALIWFLIIFELLAEPPYAINQFQLNFKKRSKFESVSVFARCMTTFAVVLISQRSSFAARIEYDGIAVVAFALGQFAYSLLIFIQYQVNFSSEMALKPEIRQNSISIRRIHSTTGYYYIDARIFKIWRSLFVQMVFKHLLTEGDKLLINYLCTVEEQGTYAVVTNYGSIIARLVFQPIEESLRLFFTRMLSQVTKKDVSKSFTVMQYLCIFYFNLCLLIGIAGYANSAYLLQFLLGGRASKWANTGIFHIFPQYITYIPFLAFNGILEAFFSSVADGRDIRRFSIFMSVLTIVILLCLYIFITHFQMGISGLILANSINMLLRIGYCSFFIRSFYQKNGISISVASALKRIRSPLAVGISIAILQYFALHGNLKSTCIFDLFKSACLCLICLLIMLYIERGVLHEPLMNMKNNFVSKRNKTAKIE